MGDHDANVHRSVPVPANHLMSWEPKARRWWIQYKGKRYVISCRQLGAVQTKEASYRAANSWWVARKAELDGTPTRGGLPPYHPHESEIAVLGRKRDWAVRHGMPDLAAGYDRHIREVERLGPDDAVPPDPEEATNIAARVKVAEALDVRVPADLGTVAARMMFGDDRVWEDRFRRDGAAGTAPGEETVGGLIRRWLASQEMKVRTGQLSPGRHNNVRYCLGHFRDFVGDGVTPGAIDGPRWRAFYDHCLGMVRRRDDDPLGKDGWSRDYAAEVFKVSRRFVRWLWVEEVVELPRNLDSRDFTFGTDAKTIRPMRLDDFKKLAERASAKVELYLLLMANCGFRSKDIGDLLDSEVDWERGRIKRKRSKTRRHKDVPDVDYPLWGRTFALLKRFRSGSARVLVTTTGRPLVEEWLDDGLKKLKSKDAVTMCYQRLQKATGITSPLGSIRKASATLLESDNSRSRFRDLFLGHSAKGLGEKHYAATAQAAFDEAVKWLGERYGL